MTVERSGGGDPDRTLALLWRARAGESDPSRKSTRGRKPKLTVDQIVRAAVAVADEEGLAATSMGRVAAELGAGTMSIYTYIPGKAELIDLMADAVLVERELPGSDSAPESWRARIELYAERTRAVYHRHPWLRQISTVRPPIGPGLLAQQEYLLSALSGIGLAPREMNAAVGAIVSFVDATAAIEVENRQTERLTGQSGDAWWAARESFWTDYFDEDQYPAMTSTWNAGGFEEQAADQTNHASEFGLLQLLNGIQTTIETRPVLDTAPSDR